LFVLAPCIDEDAVLGPQSACGILVPTVREQPVISLPGHEDASRTFVALGIVKFEAREIIAIGCMGYEQGAQIALLQGFCQVVSAFLKDGRHSRRGDGWGNVKKTILQGTESVQK